MMSKNKFLMPGLLVIMVQVGIAATLPDTMLTNMWNFSLTRLRATMTALGNSTTQFPRRAPQIGGVWQYVAASDWTSGFYPGCLWLAYQKSGDTTFRNAAQKWTTALSGQSTNTTTHDVGFMIFTSYGNGYKLMNTSSYLSIIQTAAQSLSTRYRPLAGVIDSWSFAPYDTGWEEIMDNMMNLELLYWTAANGGSSTYYNMALSHAAKAMTNHFRADSSTYHVVRYSRLTGAMISQETRQGYANWSCWSRGQAWAVYGFTMAYRFTKNAQFLATAKKAAAYYMRRLPADRIPFWDFDAPGIPSDTVPRDASSSAIVASGLFELSTLTGPTDSVKYRDTAISLIKGLWTTKYRGLTTQASILNHSTGSRMEGHDVDMGIIYADYYFLEALLRYEKYSTPATAILPRLIGQEMTTENKSVHQNGNVDFLGRQRMLNRKNAAPGVVLSPTTGKTQLDMGKK